jgi:DNA-binding XRE family transcriptional regulator
MQEFGVFRRHELASGAMARAPWQSAAATLLATLGGPGEVLVTSAQIRAARGLLDWTVRDLAERSGVHRDMVSKIETGAYAGAPAILEAIRRTSSKLVGWP